MTRTVRAVFSAQVFCHSLEHDVEPLGDVKCYLLLKLIITVLHIFHVTISIWVNEKWGSEMLKNKFLEIWCWFHILLKNIYTIWYSEFDLPFQRMMSTSWQIFKRHFNHWGCDLPRLTPDDLWPDPEFYMMFLYIRHCVFFFIFYSMTKSQNVISWNKIP